MAFKRRVDASGSGQFCYRYAASRARSRNIEPESSVYTLFGFAKNELSFSAECLKLIKCRAIHS